MDYITIVPKSITQRADLELLDSYGFDFQRNIIEYLHSIAEEMRKAIKENENTKNN